MRFRLSLPAAGLLVLSLAAAGAGCGNPNSPVRVSGVVTLDGTPLTNARVLATPVGEGTPASGDTDSSGSFRLTTFKPEDGAVPGRYKVTVELIEPTPDFLKIENPATRARKFQEWQRKQASGKKKVAGHPNYGNAGKTPLTLEVPPRGEVKFELNKNGT